MDPTSKHPLKIGQRFLVCPADRCDPVDNRIPIYLVRARAFGSGLHETTVSCLEEIESVTTLSNSSVLDVGCGTGVLSVGALLLGAGRATAFDIDPESARACASNARLNGVHDQLDVFCGTLEALTPLATFDLILANIYGDIILEMAPDMAEMLDSGGTMILSGITFEHMSDIRRAFEKLGLQQTVNRIMEEYVTMVWENNSRFKIQDSK